MNYRKWWVDENSWVKGSSALPVCIEELEALLLGETTQHTPQTGVHTPGTPSYVSPSSYAPFPPNLSPAPPQPASFGAPRSPAMQQLYPQPYQQFHAQAEFSGQDFRPAVFLSDTSQELLLSIVPPLHPIEATMSPSGLPSPLRISVGDLSASLPQILADLPPVGHEMVVEVVGIAADDRTQAVALRGPPWLNPPPTSHTPAHLLISRSPEAHPAEAGELIALGLAGALGDCYQPLDEGLPLVGVLGVLAADGRVLTADEVQQLLLKQHSSTAQDAGHGTLCSQGNGASACSVGAKSCAPASQPGPASEAPVAGASTHGGSNNMDGRSDGRSAQEGGSEQPGSSEGSPEDDDFEMWMQLDERAAPGAHLPPKKPAPSPDAAGGAIAAAPPEALGPPVAGERMRWLDDVSIGDLVEVVPLSAHTPAHPHKASADGEEGEDVVEERVQGIVDEVMTDDMFQTQGVLVRLQEDNTMGHVARVLASQHRQRQQEWPSLLQGTGAAAAVASSPALAGDEPAQAAVEEDEATEDMLLSSLPSGKAKSKKQQQQQPRNGNASGAANRPVGGVQVLYKSSKKGKATGGAGGRLGNFVARQMQMGGVQMGGDGAAGSARALETWQALQESYGEFVTSAVKKDCNGDMEQAISVLLDQDSLLDRLAVIVERSVQQVEEEVAAAAAAAAAQEAARCERAAAPGRRRGGWSGSRPGTYGAAAGARPSPADPNSFPSLPSQHCDRTGRPRALHPRTVPPWKHKGGGMTESWGASETLTGRVKVLQNSDSLSNLAHQHGLHVRDVEALKQLFPTLDNPFLVSTLADVKGDVTAAFDYLLDAGILPGHAPEMDDLFDLGGGNNNNTGSYLAAAASTPDGGKQQGTDVPDPSIWGGQPDGLPFEEKVVRLLGAFEGLDSSLAEFTLRQCNEDLAAAAAFLHECLHADNSASAAAAAQSEAVAAAIARPDSYAGVAELSSAQGPVPEFITDAAGKQTAQAGVSQATHSSSLFNQQQQAAADGSEGGNGQARAAGGVSQEDGGWQTAPVRSNGWKERAGASAKDAADKERSRLQSGKARQIAHIYYNFRNVFFQQANAAYNAGDGKAAAEFSRRGRQYGELAKQFRQASNEEAYKASNLGIRNTFVMDLHGMHVTEALALLERQMDALGRLVSPEGVLLKCITGWGAHSARGIALIKPAVLDWAKQKGCKHFVEPGNDGVVIVHVTPNDGPHHR